MSRGRTTWLLAVALIGGALAWTDGAYAQSCVGQPNGTPCNDGVFCNGADSCSGGACVVHAGNPCPGPDGDGNCAESCNGATQSCTTNDPNGSACNDVNTCTTGDACQNGVCVSGGPASNGTPCSDGNDCTTGDTCQGGSCTSGAAAPNGTLCVDGLFCNGPDTCSSGSCSVHAGNPCPGPDGDGNCVESCNETLDNCASSDPNGSACSDGNTCTGGDTCQSGSCAAGPPVSNGTSCNDGNSCRTGENCQSGVCTGGTPVANGTGCNDGLSCTITDACQSGVCLGTGNPCPPSDPFCFENTPAFPCGDCRTAADCVEDPSFCRTASCDTIHQCGVVTNHAQCNDGQVCNGTEFCNVGTDSCAPGTPIPCNNPDFPVCANDLGGQCVECNIDPDCSDGLACTGLETCVAHVCVPGTPVDCSGQTTFCHLGVCLEPSGTCGTQPRNENQPCSDDNACTLNEHCVNGNCTGSIPNLCNDGNLCTDDSCIAPAGCSNEPNANACNDNSACTIGDQCSQGSCVGVPVVCDDGNYCNGAETCNPTTGCVIPGNPCCPGSVCNETLDTCVGCTGIPTAVAEGARYIKVILASHPSNVAIRVVGDPGDPQTSCVDLFVQTDGRLGATAVYRSVAAWGTVRIKDLKVYPEKKYRIQTDCGPSPRVNLSPCVTVQMWKRGDGNNDGVVDFSDLAKMVDFFQGFPPPGSTIGNFDFIGPDAPNPPGPCMVDGVLDFRDISVTVDTFQQVPNPCAKPCP